MTSPPQFRPDRIMQFTWGYTAPLIIEAAIRHRVFDLLSDGSRTVEELSKESEASVRGLRAIMNALVGFELLFKHSEDRYANTSESQSFLVSTSPGFLGGLFKHVSTQLVPKWLDLSEVVRTGKPKSAVNQESEGGTFFEQFVEDIFPMSYPAARALAGELKIGDASGTVRVLDIAAGSGVWGIALAQASNHVRVTAVDWPEVIPVTRRMAGRFGLGGRFEFVSGDLMSADFGSGHGIATLGHILHSEGEDRSRRLLKKVYEALTSGGTIAIQEFLVNDDRTGPPNGLIFAVNMLVNTEHGDTYSLREIGSWLEHAGFAGVRTIETPGPSPIVLATRP